MKALPALFRRQAKLAASKHRDTLAEGVPLLLSAAGL